MKNYNNYIIENTFLKSKDLTELNELSEKIKDIKKLFYIIDEKNVDDLEIEYISKSDFYITKANIKEVTSQKKIYTYTDTIVRVHFEKNHILMYEQLSYDILSDIYDEIDKLIQDGELKLSTLSSAIIRKDMDKVYYLISLDLDWFEIDKEWNFSFAEKIDDYLSKKEKEELKNKFPEKWKEYLLWKDLEKFNI